MLSTRIDRYEERKKLLQRRGKEEEGAAEAESPPLLSFLCKTQHKGKEGELGKTRKSKNETTKMECRCGRRRTRLRTSTKAGAATAAGHPRTGGSASAAAVGLLNARCGFHGEDGHRAGKRTNERATRGAKFRCPKFEDLEQYVNLPVEGPLRVTMLVFWQ